MQFVKYKGWLIPRTDADIQLLYKKGLRLTKYDINFLPTLKLVVRGEDIEIADFVQEVFDPMLDKLERFWCRTEKNRIFFETNRLKLVGGNDVHNIQRLRTIETKLRYFFSRWGFSIDVVPNQTKTKCGLAVDYTFDRNPVIQLADGEHDPDFDPAILEFGEYRLVLSQRTAGYGFSFEKRTNTDWEVVAQQTQLDYDTLKTSHMIATLFDMFNIQSAQR